MLEVLLKMMIKDIIFEEKIMKKVKKLEKLNLDLSINMIKDKGALSILEILKYGL